MTWIESYLANGTASIPSAGMEGLAEIDFMTSLQAIEKVGPSRNWAATIEVYKACFGLHAGDIALLPMAWMNLGVELGLNGDRAGARICSRNSLVLRPDFHHAATNLGLMQEADGELAAAPATWNAALQFDEARIALLNQRGRLFEQTGHLEAAERVFVCQSVHNRPAIRCHPALGALAPAPLPVAGFWRQGSGLGPG